jgi:hypothetical protein
MNRHLYILVFFLLFMACSHNSSQTEKEYIKNLEEKNRILERELQELKIKNDTKYIDEGSKTLKITKDYFTIGSAEKEVIEIMGDPTSYLITAPEAKKFHYGLSTVYFYKGKVISYDNLDENLKVKVKR